MAKRVNTLVKLRANRAATATERGSSLDPAVYTRHVQQAQPYCCGVSPQHFNVPEKFENELVTTIGSSHKEKAMGPDAIANEMSVGGARFYITFIDDHSNCSVVYPMRKKSESFHYYKKFANFSETHTGNRIKALHKDGGGEYLSDDFESNLNENGTEHQLTAAYKPEQNGVGARLNRKLMKLVRSMLANKPVSKRF